MFHIACRKYPTEWMLGEPQLLKRDFNLRVEVNNLWRRDRERRNPSTQG